MTSGGTHSVLRLAFALLTFVALGVQLGRTPSVANFVSLFTVQSNLLAATVLLVAAVRGLWGRDLAPLDMWRGAAALYMATTGAGGYGRVAVAAAGIAVGAAGFVAVLVRTTRRSGAPAG
ncbi:MAG: hypothetical protein QN159_05050 [Armatimonadota bacterium]|nr:hypothetical protein [Armatimonadota bacterium]